MNSLTFTLGLLILFSCSCSNKSEITNLYKDEEKKNLRYLKEVEWPKAYREQDTILLDRILGAEFQMIDNSGNWTTKQDELDWISNNSPSYDSFYFDIKRFEILENGTAIINGTGHIFNDTVETVYQSSNVLIKRGENWKAVMSHVSGVKKAEE